MEKKLILVSGKMQSGKNTFADLLSEELVSSGKTVRFDLFAKSLKDGVWDDFYALHTFVYREYWKLPPEVRHLVKWMNVEKDNFYENKSEYGRLLLQIYGTEIFRNRVDDLYWVKTVEKRYVGQEEQYCVVTDVRFPNEIEYFKSHYPNVVTIRVNRTNRNGKVFNDEHFSEKALDGYSNFDIVVDNDGSLEELSEKVKSLVTEL